MAYYFTVHTKKGVYTPIDITKSKYFTRLSNFKGMGMSLQEVDMFTMMFDDEKELRRALFKEGLLEHRYSGKKLSTRLLRNQKYYKVMYDFLYQKDMEYIGNPNLIIEKIDNKLRSGDFRFINAFANNYLEFHECLSTAPEVREFAMQSIRDGIISKHFYDLDENRDNPLVRMAKLLIYKHYQKGDGTIVYEDEVIYRNLHSVIAFVNNYDNKYMNENNDDQVCLFDTLPTKKKALKKDKQIEGQYSLFE